MDNLILTLIQITAYVIPFFLIPATFKFGLGVFGNLAGMINDRGRGLFDRQRKFREGQRQKYRERAMSGNRFAGGDDTNLRGRLNRGIANSMNAPGAILDSGSTFRPGNWRQATRVATQNRNLAEIERNMKENAAYQSWIHDDGLNRAASETNNRTELRDHLSKMRDDNGNLMYQGRELEDAVNRVETVRRSMGADSFRAMTTRQAVAGGTAYKSKPGQAPTAAGEVWAAVARAAGNDDAMASALVASGRSDGMKAGRIDYAGAGFGATLGVVNKMRDELRRTGTISQGTIEQATRDIHKEVYEGQGGASLVHSSMKPDAVKDMAPEMVRTVDEALTAGDSRDITQKFASLAAMYDGMQGSSPAKARVIADDVLSKTIDIATLTPEMKERLQPALRQVDDQGNETIRFNGTITYQQAIDGLRGNNEFKEMRREYQNEVDRVRSMGGTPPPGTAPGTLPPPPGGPPGTP